MHKNASKKIDEIINPIIMQIRKEKIKSCNLNIFNFKSPETFLFYIKYEIENFLKLQFINCRKLDTPLKNNLIYN